MEYSQFELLHLEVKKYCKKVDVFNLVHIQWMVALVFMLFICILLIDALLASLLFAFQRGIEEQKIQRKRLAIERAKPTYIIFNIENNRTRDGTEASLDRSDTE